MQSFRIKRWREPSADADAKADLRAYVDQMSIDQQREFVALATQLIDARHRSRPVQHETSPRRAALEMYC